MRKTKTVTITADGRDKGKIFVITEMPASQAEEWAMRALEAIAQRSQIPSGLQNAGMFGIFILGLQPLLAAPFGMMKPLLDEMFASCLSIQPGAKDENGAAILRGSGTPLIKAKGPMVEEDIEEVATRVYLRDQIFLLHTGFSLAAVLSQTWEKVLATADLLNTRMSPEQSEQSSPEIRG